MEIVEKPKVFLIGESRIVSDPEFGIEGFLNELGVPYWDTDAPSDAEKLVETYGRLCYLSYDVGLNPNVERIRKGNANYIGNSILKPDHGAVLEHGVLNFVFTNVSRVLTHELVRHRIGVAISQTSLRYVRLDDLSTYVPVCIRDNEEAFTFFCEKIEQAEQIQRDLAEMFNIEQEKDFKRKKELTSAFRRLAPMGLATHIGWSCNFRALRHVIALRTDIAAEEEIRAVLYDAYRIASERYPNVFQDAYVAGEANGIPWIKFSMDPLPDPAIPGQPQTSGTKLPVA